MSLVFKKADIVPGENEYFLRLDGIEHFLKITYKDQELISELSNCGLTPNWNFTIDLEVDNLEQLLTISILRSVEKEINTY